MPDELQNVQEDEVTSNNLQEESPQVIESETTEPEKSAEEEIPVEESESEDSSNIVKSERGQKRIQELAQKANKAKELEREVQNLRSKLVDEPVQHKATTDEILENLKAEGVPYTGDYVQDLRIAEERAASKALRQFEETQLKRERFVQDIASLEAKYPELNKERTDVFDEDLTDSLVKDFKEFNLKPEQFKTYVERVMNLRKQSETKGKVSSVDELVKQEQQSAIKPTPGAVRESKTYNEMSLEELEALIPHE